MEKKKKNNEEENILNKINEMIDEMRPFLNMEGGDIEFIKYEDNYLYIRMLGTCASCIFQSDTIESGLLASFQNEIPEIKGIINVEL